MSAKLGISLASLAFVLYGLYPLYFNQLKQVPFEQIACHRVVWCYAALLPLFFAFGHLNYLINAAITPRTMGLYVLSAIALGGSWVLFLWGVDQGYILEISLGFFINPVLSIALAVFVLHEPLRLWQKVSVAFASAGVIVVAAAYGRFPFVGIGLGVCLASYGLLKNLTPLESLDGVMLEISILFPPSLIYLLVVEVQGAGIFLHTTATIDWLLVGAGILTAIPVLLFAFAAPLISFTLLGLLQYIGPIINFFLGLFVFHESFATSKLIGFVFVWTALILFGIESFFYSRQEANQVDKGIIDSPNTLECIVITPCDDEVSP